MFNDLSPLLQNIVPHSVNAWAVILGSGLSVAVILQLIKHFGQLQEAKKFVMFLLGMLSFLASYADSFLAYTSQHPELLPAANMGWVIAAAVFIHRFTVSPVYHKLINFLNGIYADARAYRQEQAALQAITTIPAASEHEFSLPSEVA